MNERNASQQADDYRRVEEAIRFLEANYRARPTLEQVAASVHLSRYHFQRLFKRWAGISPTQFMHYLTVEFAKERLRESRSVLDAALEAGLSGPGRLHDLFVSYEALSPGEFKQQGAGLQIEYGFRDTPFGRCLLAVTARGICWLAFVQENDQTALGHLVANWPRAALMHQPDRIGRLIDHIFAPDDRPQPFHLLLKGTNFQVKVWQALLAIPAGAMVSYQDIAGLVGRPKATRAVANAIARNPVAYLIPCHRVIRGDGHAHGYRWGTPRKKAMLAWEAGRPAPPAAAD